MQRQKIIDNINKLISFTHKKATSIQEVAISYLKSSIINQLQKDSQHA